MKRSLLFASLLKGVSIVLILAGIVLMAVCYYVFFHYTRPVQSFQPLAGRLDEGRSSFRVAMFSDCGLKTHPLKAVAADVTQKYKPDFVLFLGDMALRGTPEEWSYTAGVMREAFGKKMRIFGTPGNHDVPDVSAAMTFISLFGYGDTFFGYGDTLFVMLNTAYQCVDDWQFEWLESVLKKERPAYRRCVLATHVPPIDPNHVKNHALSPEEARKLQELTDRFNVNLIVCGHVHVFTDIPFGKARLIILPSSGQKIRDSKEKKLGYVRFDFKPDGSIAVNPVFVPEGRTTDKISFFLAADLNHKTLVFSAGLGCVCLGLILLWISSAVRRRTRKED